jgi:hypothetical protein
MIVGAVVHGLNVSKTTKQFRELGAQRRRKLSKLGLSYGHEKVERAAESYPHLIHAVFL